MSTAFRNAKSPQLEIILIPPFEMKGRVTPVKGKISTVPRTFRAVWKISRDVAEHAAIV